MLLPLEHILPETITLIAYLLIIKENILIEDGSGPGVAATSPILAASISCGL